MARTPGDSSSGSSSTAKTRKPRSPSPPKTTYFVMQVLDESGQPMLFDRERVRLLMVETNSDKMLEIVEGKTHPFAFYIRHVAKKPATSTPVEVPQAA